MIFSRFERSPKHFACFITQSLRSLLSISHCFFAKSSAAFSYCISFSNTTLNLESIQSPSVLDNGDSHVQTTYEQSTSNTKSYYKENTLHCVIEVFYFLADVPYYKQYSGSMTCRPAQYPACRDSLLVYFFRNACLGTHHYTCMEISLCVLSVN